MGRAQLIVGAAPEYPEDLGAGERAALVATWLQGGRTFTTSEAARLLGLSPLGARRLLWRLSAVCPIRQDGRVWRWGG